MSVCPKCGGNLSKHGEFFKCDDCGAAFKRKASERERSEQPQKETQPAVHAAANNAYPEHDSAHIPQNDIQSILNALQRLLQPLQEISGILEEISKQEKYLGHAQKKVQNKADILFGGLIGGVVGIIYFFWGLAVLLSGKEIAGGLALILTFLAHVAAGAGIGFLVYRGRYKNIKYYTNSIDEKIEKLNQICSRINPNDMFILPPDYRHYDACQFIYKAVLNQRANNIQQAVNLYEDHLHQSRMEKMQQQQILAQQQQMAQLRGIQATSALNLGVNATHAAFGFVRLFM